MSFRGLLGWLSRAPLSQREGSGSPPAPGPIPRPANPPAPLARRSGGGVELAPVVLEIVDLVVEDAFAWVQEETSDVYFKISTRELAEEYTRVVGRRRIGVVLRRKLHPARPVANMKADRMQES